MKYIFIFIIRVYQKTLSPDHGLFKARYPYGFCRFYPSCSQYAIEAITEHGAAKGLVLATKRVIHCNPFSSPKIDNVPRHN